MNESSAHTSPSPQPPSGAPRDRLWSVSFVALLVTQLMTAINDNVFRWLAIGIGKDYVEPSEVGTVLMAGTACFVLPYLLLAAPAGYLADRFSKRTVIVGCKIAEIVIMSLGVLVISADIAPKLNLIFLFIVVAMMGAQSAIFSPSKLGCIPELLRPERISAANGLFGLATVAATVIGMGAGSWLSDATGFRGKEHWWLSAVVLLTISAGGTLISLLIHRLPAANPARRFPWDAARQTWRDLRTLASNRALMRVALGVTFFWSVGGLATLNIDQFAFEGGAMKEIDKLPLLVSLVFGVGLGSVLAGIWSGDRVELGILPLGALGVAVCSMLLFSAAGTILEPTDQVTAGLVWACFLLLALGTCSGLFSVPLEAYLQHRSPVKQRGSILAATNFLVFTGVLLSSLLFDGLRSPAQPGALENIARVRTSLESLSGRDIEQVDALVTEFQAAWEGYRPLNAEGSPAADRSSSSGSRTARATGATDEQRPKLRAYVDRASAPQRELALAKLMWTEVKYREKLGDFLDKYTYYDMFEDVYEKELAKEVFDQAGDLPLFSARQIFLLAGIGTIPVFLYIAFLIPQASVRFLVWLASHTAYRIRILDRHHLPEEGGALLVANHVSWLDGILLLLTSSRTVRILAFVRNMRGGPIRWMAKMAGVILVAPDAREIKVALHEAREALNRGELVGIFPEGGMTRSGILQTFRPGMMKVLDGTRVPVIPVYLDELWGSIFSFHGGRYFWKWPRKWPYPISIHFGPPVDDPRDSYRLRRAVQDLGATAVQKRSKTMPLVTEDFIRSCKRQSWRSKVADSMDMDLTGGQLLMRTMITRRLLRREVLSEDERNVGVLLPPSVPAVVINAALALDGRVAVNLNYTVSQDVMRSCIEQAGIRHVLTTGKVLEKLDVDLGVDTVLLEEYRPKVTLVDKLLGAVWAYAVPSSILIRHLRLRQATGDDLMTLIFTSGSTGEPKGVMLTHGNVASNVEAVEQVVRLVPGDVLLGILPFFHSFGYTITLWTVLSLNVKGVYHFNPLDARQVGKLCRRHGGTILLATPTFLRSYTRRCEKEDLATVDVVVTGAEKLPVDVTNGFEAKFGVRPIEGYGCTETSPLASVNVPPSRSQDGLGVDCKEGTVGRPIPGVSAKTIDLDTGADLDAGQPGMLLIKGPNIMKGYLGRPDLTAQVIRDGWYVTGDVGLIDEDGFIKITGRESRFSKIGGEMVPHIQVEETLAGIIGNAEEALHAAVTAVPDARKGERLVVVHTPLEQSPSDLCAKLSEAGLPNIFIPSPDSFVEVEELPVLGTGKLDLKAIKEIALEHFGPK